MMIHPKKRRLANVYPDYDEVRKNITKLSYTEARRTRGPIYDVLLQEFLEQGSCQCAKHLCALIQKENQLINTQIIYRVSDNRKLLLQLFEKVQLAAILMRSDICDGKAEAFKQLYGCIELLEDHKDHYEWLLNEIFHMIADCLAKVGPDDMLVSEIKVKILHKFGLYLKQNESVATAIATLNEALDLCKGKEWYSEVTMEYMHTTIAHSIARAYFDYTRQFVNSDPKRALEVAYLGLRSLFEVGRDSDKLLLHEALMLQIICLIQCQQYEKAAVQIANFKRENTDDGLLAAFAPFRCEIHKQDAMCNYYLNDYDKALSALYRAFSIARQHKLIESEGDLWLWMGKTYASRATTQGTARLAYIAAKRYFSKLYHDYEKVRIVDYLTAKMKADEIFPQLMRNVKDRQYCAFYHLRRWKNQCEPFWIDLTPAELDVENDTFVDLDPLQLLTNGDTYEVGRKSRFTVGMLRWLDIEFMRENEEYLDSKAKVACLLDEYPHKSNARATRGSSIKDSIYSN